MSGQVLTDVQAGGLGGLPTAARARPRLSWTGPDGAERTHVATGQAVLGTAPDVDVRIEDPAVSRLHAALEPREDGVWIRDLASRNGTWVEGIRVECARLEDGCRLRLGGTSILVRYETTAQPLELWPFDRFGGLLGRSVPMRELFARIAKVAPTDASVLIQGETGTGKELVARAIHEASPRAAGPFVVVDLAALPETLAESELFGHVKGAFTGAESSRAGAPEQAAGGTVFLDEIGELPLALQPKLLRLLETRTVRRLGDSTERPLDVRFVAATHRDLRAAVNAGAFREDLYFRLAVLTLAVPPLRERREDLALLAESFLPKGASGALSPELTRALAERPWLGNVRELRNFMERAAVFGADEALRAAPTSAAPAPLASGLPAPPLDVPFKELRDRWLDHLERSYLEGLLLEHGGNVSAVAQAAGLDRTYVHRLIRKHDL